MADDEGFGEGGGTLCLCQKDSYVHSLQGVTVLSCEAKTRGKGKDQTTVYEVVLSDSPLFPEGGGQPTDKGTLKVQGEEAVEDADVEVLEVVRDKGRVVHITAAPVAAGSKADIYVDWGRRWDHMQQHTGQHVVSAVCEILVPGAATVSWELHPDEPGGGASGTVCSLAVDLAVPALTPEQVAAIEARANDEVRKAREVRPLLLDPQTDAQRIDQLREDPNFRGALPPADKIKGGVLRLVEVAGLDVNACGGTHVRSTAELQVIKVVGLERTRGQVRLRMAVGGRILASLARSMAREAGLTQLLSCPPAEHERSVAALQASGRDSAKAKKALGEELASLLGKGLAEQAAARAGGTAAGAPGEEAAGAGAAAGAGSTPLAAQCHRPGAELDFLSLIASAALEAQPSLLVLLTADNGPSSPGGAAQSVEVTFLLAGPPDAVKASGPKVAALFGGRGGGRPGRFQGKAPVVAAKELPRLLQEAGALLGL